MYDRLFQLCPKNVFRYVDNLTEEYNDILVRGDRRYVELIS